MFPYAFRLVGAACLMALVAAGVWLGWSAIWPQGNSDYRRDVALARSSGAPIIPAIEAFTVKNRRLRYALKELVPAFLPAIPPPGPAAKGEWFYRTQQHSALSVEAGKWAIGIKIHPDKSPNPFSFGDYFVYHRSKLYPKEAYGGVLERFGDWAYYHE